MRSVLLSLLSLCAVACSPIPELVGVFQVPDGGAEDLAASEPFPPRPDLSSGMSTAPCPKTFGTTVSYCYWPQGQGDQNLGTALSLVGMDPNCALMAGRLSANAAGLSCSAEFKSSLVMGWMLSMTKPVSLTLAYSVRPPIDRATLTVSMPSGSPNSVLSVSGIAGSGNIVSLSTPMGTMFAPGIGLTLAGAAKRGTLTIDWIAISQ